MKHQFQQFFNHDFSNYSEFLRQVLFPIFGEENFLKGYDILTQEPGLKQKAIEANIEEIKHVGTFTTDLAVEIKVFDVLVSDHCHINRSRIKIQTLIRSYVETFEGAFMIFHYKNTINRSWRFSYVEKRSSSSDSTSAKRYTYLFGESYACRTAAQRFFELYKLQKNITLQNITETFSVEALSDEFFEKYRSLYADFIQFITGKRYEKEKGKWVEKVKHAPNIQFETSFENNDKAVRDYVKKMMGRLVFLQFLQKKGWLGVPADKPWGYGNTNYLQQLFEKSNQKQNFLEVVLEPLFFDTLNQERTNQIADRKLGENIKIPYLNGGLFEKDELDKKVVVFPAEYFNKLFDFFGEYNFTIDENDPNDAELGVDPEMLGRIFENLLEDNKDKGAYYTPKEIVHYMCQESLTEYLCTKLDIQDEIAERDAINQLLKNKIVKPILKPKIDDLEKALDQVKICDPAIGSGAFPMGLLQEIFSIKGLIAQETGKEWNPTETKLNIIQNSIYGVDIEKGAVDIARLRFWLSLLVDEETPKPLPNLDYKIMVGDSLVSKFEHTVIEIDWDKTMSVGEGDIHIKTMQKALRDISDKQKQFFDINNHNKKLILKTEIRNLKLDILIAQLSFNRAAYVNKNQKIMEMGFGLTSKDQKHNLEIDMNIKDFDYVIEKIETLKTNDKPFNHFDWTLDFPKELNPYLVTDSNQRGFDIVIGNPPYVEAKKLKDIAINLKKYKITTGTSDLSVYFLEKGIILCKEKGTLFYITTNKFFHTGYGKPVRNFILENQLLQIIDFEQVEVFEDILVSSVIIGMKKTHEQIEKIVYKKFYKFKKTDFKKHFINNKTSFGKYEIKFLTNSEWSFANNDEVIIKEKIENAGPKICTIKGISVYRGVTTGYNPAFIIDNEKKKELIAADKNNEKIIKQLLQGRNIRKWIYNYNNENIIFTKQGIEIDRFPVIKNYLSNFFSDLKPRKDNNEKSGRKAGCYQWYEIQDNTAYYSQFEKSEKIIWGLTADKWAFAYDNKQHYLPSNGYILTSTTIPIKYLLGLLNSKVLKYYFSFIGVMTAGGAYTLKHGTIQQLPIVITKNQQPIITLVDYILRLYKLGEESPINNFVPNKHLIQLFEEIIDACVFELYFKEDFEKNDISFLKYVDRDFKTIDGLSDSVSASIIHSTYQTLRESKNEIRNNLKLMDIELAYLIMPIKSLK